MKQIIYCLCLLFLTTFSQVAKAQPETHSGLRISLITCTPGDDLYSIFGHSAIRVIDSVALKDYVFNYGTFDFDDKNFYIKFMRGKLLYFLSMDNTADFISFYQYFNRGITEQVLQLTDQEKISIQRFLYNNLKNENKFYQYDFFYDNCTTRPRDIILKNTTNRPVLPFAMSPQTTFRSAIHQYLDRSGQSWSKLGIDILLGVRTDKIMTAEEQQFLPDNLMASIDQSQPKLVKEKISLYTPLKNSNSALTITPAFIFWGVSLMLILIGFLSFRGKQIFFNFFDTTFFILLGLLGILLILMWVATDHSMTKDNFNLMWAHPLFLLIPFLKYLSPATGKKILSVLFVCNILTLAAWFIQPQQLNLALFPIALLSSVRLYKRFRSA